MTKKYTVIRRETKSENLVGSTPTPLASNIHLDAHLLERRSDRRLFLLIGPTTFEGAAIDWAERTTDWEKVV